MKYMGSKARIAKLVIPTLLRNRVKEQYYIEPFCGGCNMIEHVKGNRIASDNNKYLIAMWKGLQEGREYPTEIDRDLYDRARIEFRAGTNNEFDNFLLGWIGFMASFNGKFFDGGYGGITNDRNYIDEQIRNVEAQIPRIKDIEFKHGSYDTHEYPDNSIIYCDIPYKDTTAYSTSKGFDYDKFYKWCRNMIKKGHQVFVSEYTAPDDFVVVWDKVIRNTMNATNTHNPVECVFVHESQKELTEKFW